MSRKKAVEGPREQNEAMNLSAHACYCRMSNNSHALGRVAVHHKAMNSHGRYVRGAHVAAIIHWCSATLFSVLAKELAS